MQRMEWRPWRLLRLPSLPKRSDELDAIFSYDTARQVVIKKTGISCCSLLLNVGISASLAYVVITYSGLHFATEEALGFAHIHVREGSVASIAAAGAPPRIFSPEEVSSRGLEPGGLFVATKFDITREVRGRCVDPHRPCVKPTDCGGTAPVCTPTRLCEEPGWCPDGPAPPATYRLEADDVLLWVKSAVHFRQLSNSQLFANDMAKPSLEPGPGRNVFSVRDLLEMSSPPMRYEDIADTGAVINVLIMWRCDLDHPDRCAPSFEAHHLSDAPGNSSSFNGAELTSATYDGTDWDHRERRDAHGIHFNFQTVGVGKSFSILGVVLEASFIIALMGFVPVFFDPFFLWCARRRGGARDDQKDTKYLDMGEDDVEPDDMVEEDLADEPPELMSW